MPPAVSTLETLTEYADELLALCEAALIPTEGGAIARAYLASPGPAFDCEQLTVEISSLGDAALPAASTMGAGRRHVTGALNLVGFRVLVLRDCVPVIGNRGEIPSPTAMRAAAIIGHQDVFAIWTRVRTAQLDETLFGGSCDSLFYDGAIGIETEGGMAGYQIDFRAEIAGFVNSGS